MSVATTILFGKPQKEIKSLLEERISRSNSTSIVTGFATPGGIKAIENPIKARPTSVKAIIVGAATYPGFEALDSLVAAGVSIDRLFVHLGHTRESDGKKNPTVRFHPMLHSKIFYMELPDEKACAFIGSHNMTSFALKGLNGEAGVLLEGALEAIEFQQIRDHIEEAKKQAVQYLPWMKDAFAWWTGEYIDGLKAEVKIPQESIAGRSILICAKISDDDLPKAGDQLYFEIPSGIKIETLKTETHLFLFKTMPANSLEGIYGKPDAFYTCETIGADNERGNLEVKTNWKIVGKTPPTLESVPTKTYRPKVGKDVQQIRVKVKAASITPYTYIFEGIGHTWEPSYSDEITDVINENQRSISSQTGDPDDRNAQLGWKLVRDLIPREITKQSDAAALELVKPDSGSFILVSLRKKRKNIN